MRVSVGDGGHDGVGRFFVPECILFTALRGVYLNIMRVVM